MGRAKPLPIKDRCDLGIHHLHAVEFKNTVPQLIFIRMLRVALDSSLQPMLACSAGLPNDSNPDESSPPFLIEYNVLDD
jgi:hypothetical protein